MSIKRLLLFFTFSLSTTQVFAGYGDKGIKRNSSNKTIKIGTPDKSILLVIDYSNGCVIKELWVKGKNVLAAGGIETGIVLFSETFTASKIASKMRVVEAATSIKISGIQYGDSQLQVTEDWDFKLTGNAINWKINRKYSADALLKDNYFPRWNFADLIQKDQHIALKFSHSTNGVISFSQILADKAFDQEYNLSRFVSSGSNVFTPFKVKKNNSKTGYYEKMWD